MSSYRFQSSFISTEIRLRGKHSSTYFKLQSPLGLPWMLAVLCLALTVICALCGVLVACRKRLPVAAKVSLRRRPRILHDYARTPRISGQPSQASTPSMMTQTISSTTTEENCPTARAPLYEHISCIREVGLDRRFLIPYEFLGKRLSNADFLGGGPNFVLKTFQEISVSSIARATPQTEAKIKSSWRANSCETWSRRRTSTSSSWKRS